MLSPISRYWSELAKVISCSEAAVSRALSESSNFQALGHAHTVILLDRLSMELARPGSAKSYIKTTAIMSVIDPNIADEVSAIRHIS